MSWGRLEGGLDRVRAVIGDEESTTGSRSATTDQVSTENNPSICTEGPDSDPEELDAEGLTAILTDVSDVSEDATEGDDSDTTHESPHTLETAPLEEAFGSLESEVDEETGMAPIPPSADPDDPCFEWLEPDDLEPVNKA